jgi:exopolysaccharide biosynthesis polyprenyl glycosylphosphotransferase
MNRTDFTDRPDAALGPPPASAPTRNGRPDQSSQSDPLSAASGPAPTHEPAATTAPRARKPLPLRLIDTAHPLSGRSAQQFLLGTRMLVDVVAILVGLLVGEWLQARLVQGGLAEPLIDLQVWNALVLVGWVLIAAERGLYDSRRLINATDEVMLLVQTNIAGPVAATTLGVLLKYPVQRSWVVVAWITCTITTILARSVQRRALRRMRVSGLLVSRMLIVGAGPSGQDLFTKVARKARWLGFQVVGFVDEPTTGAPAPGLPEVVGPPTDIRALVYAYQADTVLVEGSAVPRQTTEQVYRDLQGLPVKMLMSTGLLGIAANRVGVQRYGDMPVLGLRRVDLNGYQQTVKRTFDLLVAGAALLVFLPLLVACGIAVRCSGSGPILFRQRRVGYQGREFTLYKFRSMVADAEERLEELRAHNESDGPLFKMRDDPRVTRVGRFLRAWSLDELPQLLNVVRGDMSLVGPRPPLPSEVVGLNSWLRNRVRVKPGLTGMWQVFGRHEASADDLFGFDLYYVENWSLSLDLYLVVRTIPTVLRRSGV